MPGKAVIGIGNVLMGDDGIGPALIERLRARSQGTIDWDIRDEGVIGFGLVHVLKGYDNVLIIDSGDIGKAPGEFGIFSPSEVFSAKGCLGRSLHESDLIKVLETSKALGELPERVRIFAVQPKETGWKEGLSEELQKRIEEYLRALEFELRRPSV